MKRNYLFLIPIAILMYFILAACGNRQLIDTTYKFDRAIIKLPNGEVVEGKVQSWDDYDNSDTVQVKIDGVTYYVHMLNAALIDD